MEENQSKTPSENESAPETKSDLKQQSTSDSEVKKGYNEKNPLQEQGAFKPDNKSENN